MTCALLAGICVGSIACGDSSGSSTPVVPVTGEVRCDVSSIPCGDDSQTRITCTGSATHITGMAEFTWKCFHGATGVPNCTYATPPGAAQACSPFPLDSPDSYSCHADASKVQVELTCTGQVREQCFLSVAQGRRSSDIRLSGGRFTVELDPPCASMKDPQPTITSPTNGSTVTLDAMKQLRVEYTATDWTEVFPPAGDPVVCDPASQQCGHAHLFIDGTSCNDGASLEPYNTAGKSPLLANFGLCPMASGPHTITIELHHDDHSLITRKMPSGVHGAGEPIAAQVFVMVE